MAGDSQSAVVCTPTKSNMLLELEVRERNVVQKADT